MRSTCRATLRYPVEMGRTRIQVALEDKHRAYRPGETVRGTVTVFPEADVEFQKLTLSHFWETHGRGNRDAGGHESEVLAHGRWRSGRTYRYPFSFRAPGGPPTYDGRMVNVRHCVKATAALPWAKDPKGETTFVLLPPKDTAVERVRRRRRASERGTDDSRVAIMTALLIGGFVIGLAVGGPFGAILTLAAVLIGGFFGVRWALIKWAFGAVDLTVPRGSVTPGQALPVKLRFTPSLPYPISKITATLTGKERCTSGSGKSTKTHNHVFYEQEYVLASNLKAEPDIPIDARGVAQVPTTDAYSFTARNNKIIWSFEARVDVPNWPDWTESWEVEVRPGVPDATPEAAVLEPQAPPAWQEPPTPSTRMASVAALFPEAPTIQTEPADAPPAPPPLPIEQPESQLPAEVHAEPEPRETPVAPPKPPVGGDDAAVLQQAAEEVAKADRYSGERGRLLLTYAPKRFRLRVTVERADRTSAYDAPADYRRGRTLLGTVGDGRMAIAVRLPRAQNEQADAIPREAEIDVRGAFIEWDDVFHRAVIEGDFLPS